MPIAEGEEEIDYVAIVSNVVCTNNVYRIENYAGDSISRINMHRNICR